MHGALCSQGERNFALRTQGEGYARCGRSDDVVAGVARRAMLRDLNFDLVLPKVSRRVLPTGKPVADSGRVTGKPVADSGRVSDWADESCPRYPDASCPQGSLSLTRDWADESCPRYPDASGTGDASRISVTYVCVQVWDFVPRLAAAAGLEMEMPRRGEHGPQLSAILYFIDLSQVRSFFHLPFCLLPFICFSTQLLYEHSGRSPSLRVAVAVVCALRALRLPPRTPRIAHYAGLSDAQVCPTDAQRACRLS